MDIALLTKSQLDKICGCYLFEGCPRNLVEKTLSDDGCCMEKYENGQIIYDIDDYSRSFGLILLGKVSACKPVDAANSLMMASFEAGDCFGSAALFNDSLHYVTRITAKSKSTVLFFSQPLLEELMKKEFRVAQNYIRFLSERVQILNAKIQALIYPSAISTVAGYLCSKLEEGGNVISLTISYSELAGRLNIGRASLYRALDDLEKNGLILREGHKLTVPDREKLRKYGI